jgi:hypothetical protein
MPKSKPVSLFPLSFDEAISAFIKVTPKKSKTKKKYRKKNNLGFHKNKK